jgi:hypothetical protein
MKRYKITLDDGRKITIEADTPEEASSFAEEWAGSNPAKKKTGRDKAVEVGKGLGRSTALAGRALVQGAAGLVGTVYDPVRSAMALIPGVPQEQPLREIASEALTKAGVPKPETPVERLTSAATEMISPTAGTIQLARTGMNVLAQGVPRAVSATRNVLATLAAQPGQQLGGAVGSGLAAEAAREAGGGTGAQVAAGLAGGLAGGRVAGTRYEAPEAALPRNVQEAQNRGINVFTTDVMPPQGFIGGTVRRAGEAIPFVGMSGPRARQETQRINAVRQTLDEFGVDSNQLGDETLAAITQELRGQRSADLNRLTAQKNAVISNLADGPPVPVPNATRRIDAELARLTRADPVTFEPIINELQAARTALANKQLDSIETLRRAYRTMFDNPQLAGIRDEGSTTMNRIYTALNEDMGNYIRQNAGDDAFTRWRTANTELAQMIGELDVSTLRNVLNQGDLIPEKSKDLLFSNESGKIRLLYDGLTPEGRAYARQAILQRAAQKAGDINEPGAFNPTTFERELGRLERQLNIFFQGDDAAAIDGLRRALRLTSQATGARQAGMAPTGQQVLTSALAGLATSVAGGNMLTAAAVLGGTGGAIRLFESGPVRDALMRLGRVTGTAQEAEAFKRLTQALQAAREPERERNANFLAQPENPTQGSGSSVRNALVSSPFGTTPPDYGARPDGAPKGQGFLGPLTIQLPDGSRAVATEYSVGVNIDGEEMDIPTLVPTLTPAQRKRMLEDIIPNDKPPPRDIVEAAVKHARKRLSEGKSVFAD